MARKHRVDEVTLSAHELETVNVSVAALEFALRGRLMSVLFEDEWGQHFWHFRPGSEQRVVEYISALDWSAVRRVVAEHCR